MFLHTGVTVGLLFSLSGGFCSYRDAVFEGASLSPFLEGPAHALWEAAHAHQEAVLSRNAGGGRVQPAAWLPPRFR